MFKDNKNLTLGTGMRQWERTWSRKDHQGSWGARAGEGAGFPGPRAW